MIKYNSRRDLLTLIMFSLGIIASLAVVVLGLIITVSVADMMSKILAMTCIGLAGAAVASLIANLVRTDYLFFDNFFQIRGGLSKKQLSYKQIYALQKSKKMFCLNALAKDKFEILYRGEGPRIFISPENEEAFIKELKKHCKNLQIRPLE